MLGAHLLISLVLAALATGIAVLFGVAWAWPALGVGLTVLGLYWGACVIAVDPSDLFD